MQKCHNCGEDVRKGSGQDFYEGHKYVFSLCSECFERFRENESSDDIEAP